MKVKLVFKPAIYSTYCETSLNESSMIIGSMETFVYGADKEELFANIESKIWAMSSEAKIMDETISKEYNQWEAKKYKMSVPKETNGVGYFALPYSETLKRTLMGL